MRGHGSPARSPAGPRSGSSRRRAASARPTARRRVPARRPSNRARRGTGPWHLPVIPENRIREPGRYRDRMSETRDFVYQDMLPVGADDTSYRLLTTDYVSTFEAGRRRFFHAEP